MTPGFANFFPALLAGAPLALLPELLALAAAAVLAVLALRRLRLPVIAGLLLAGALAGPHGLHFVSAGEHLDAFAEIGVALLLFTIGLEFNRARIASTGLRSLLAGLAQIGLTLAAGAGVALLCGLGPAAAIFTGMVVALSSTAIVLRALTERAELAAPHGRLILGTLIMQDLAIVPLLIAVPLLAGGGGGAWAGLGLTLLKAAGLIALALAVARFIVPELMREVSAAGSRDVFLLAVLALGLGLAYLSAQAGLSPALGAFIAGILLADSEYALHTLSEVLPVRDLFFSFFFITMGMLFDWRLLAAQPLPVLGVLALLLAGKGLVAALAVLLLRFPARIALLFGLGLAQFGEFGYLLLQAGQAGGPGAGLLSPGAAGILLCAGLISMFLTPLILAAAPHFAAGEALLRPLARLLRARGIDEPESEHAAMAGHVVIAGYGPAGMLLTARLRAAGRKFVILELNSDTVRALRAAGEPAYYGDVSSREALEHAGLDTACAVVLTFHDRQAVRRALDVIRRRAPQAYVVVRAAFASEIGPLIELGADEVVAAELEVGDAVARAVLARLG